MTSSSPPPSDLILAINSGSSSLKLGFFEQRDGEEQLVLTGEAENIGRSNGHLRLASADGTPLIQQPRVLESQRQALAKLVETSRRHLSASPVIIGHRVVHGGPELTEHTLITGSVTRSLQAAVHFAPLHIPAALELIKTTEALYPHTPQVACFDTAFHRTMPEVARALPLPSAYGRIGLRRYGFHGLSYESVVHRLGPRPPQRTIVAHLGNGSSLCAIRNGRSIDTTMGLTPTGGIPMATRSGDLDPGVFLFLMRSGDMQSDELEVILNRYSGLSGLSGGESDMRALLSLSGAGNDGASLAVDAYTIAVRKTIGAYAALLSGLDLLVFTGGIGEHSAQVRDRICEGLQFLGLTSPSDRIRVMPAEEEAQIARICRSFIPAYP